MTGEITLRGRVLPVGGLKEKCLAAFRSGVETVAIPFQNRKDLEEIPRPLRNKLQFILARNMNDVLAVAFGDLPPDGTSEAPKAKHGPKGKKTARRPRPKGPGDRPMPANA